MTRYHPASALIYPRTTSMKEGRARMVTPPYSRDLGPQQMGML